MNEPVVSTPASPAAAPAASPARPSVDDRISAMMDRLASEGDAPTESAAEVEDTPSAHTDGSGASTADSAGAPAPATESTPDAAQQARQERLARIAKVREREQADKVRRQEETRLRTQHQATSGELEQLRAKTKDLEGLQSAFADPMALLEAAEKKGLTPQQFVDAIKARLTDPSAVAQHTANSVEGKLRAEIEQLKAELRQTAEHWETQQQEQIAAYHAQQRATQFVQQANAGATSHPLTADFLRKHGDAGVINFANRFVAPLLGEEYTLDELHDHMEQLLDEVQLRDGASPQQRAPATPNAANGVGQPATTLSNALSSERSTVSVPVPLHKMSLEDRMAFLRDKYSRE